VGSGKILRHAISKHGIENFVKEILFQFDNEAEMNAKEAELVTEGFCLREDTYNLCPGGKGGWGYLNSTEGLNLDSRVAAIQKWNETARAIHAQKLKASTEYRESFIQKSIIPASMAAKQKYEDGCGYWSGKTHSEETKKKLSELKIGHQHQSGSKNSQYGTFWATNGTENKKLKKGDLYRQAGIRVGL
jgi:hypothetical protein